MLQRNRITLLLLLFFIFVVACYPIAENMDAKNDVPVRDEKTFPNGTVIGKYSYLDNDGNPIHVKYYADDQGYGVELSSIKMTKDDRDQKSILQSQPVKTEQHSKIEPTAETYKYHNYLKKSVRRDQMDFLNNEAPKNHLKNKYKNRDYEIYLQNDLPSQKCGGDVEKVKIYNFEKDDYNKKIRSVLNAIQAEQEPKSDVETPKFCERY